MKILRMSGGLIVSIMILASLSTQPAFADTLYTITNPGGPNSIAGFHQDTTTGKLTLKALYPTGGTGDPNIFGCSQDTLVTDGDFLYAVNPGSHDISVFRIKADGALKRVGGPVPSGGITPITLAVAVSSSTNLTLGMNW